LIARCVVVAPTLPRCTAGVTPVFSSVTCCYNCVATVVPPVPTCNVSPEVIRICNPGETPAPTPSGCASCRPSNGETGTPFCTPTALLNCVNILPSLPACGLVIPIRTSDCCITCLPTAAEFNCSRVQLDACVVALPGLRLCAALEVPAFDRDTCCRTCRRPDPPILPIANKCVPTQTQACMTVVDTCKPGEVPIRTETNQCCPTCKRSESLCAKDDVVTCVRSIRPCVVNEFPLYIAGECCPTCVIAPPPCTTPCPTGSVCVFRKNITSCVPTKTIVVVVLRVNTNVTIPLDPTLLPTDIRTIIREVVQRFCERNENAAVCTAFAHIVEDLDALLNSITVVRNGNTITITIPNLAASIARKQSTAPDFTSLVNLALADPQAIVPFNFSPAMGTGSVAVTTKAASVSVLASIFLVLVALALSL